MREIIENKMADIVSAIVEKDPGEITKDEYDILSAELRRIIYDEDQKEKNKKIAEVMGSILGGGISGAY